MRILHFITSLRTGGAERLVTDLLPRLRAMGHDAGLILMDGTESAFSEEARKRGIEIRALGMGLRDMHNPLLAIGLRRLLKKERYDIVHTHNTPCQILAAIAAPRGTCLVTTEHSTDNRRRHSRLWRPADRLMYGRYRRIIACGVEAAESLRRYLPELSDRIVTVPNGIDLRAFAAAAPATDIVRRFAGHRVIAMVAAFRPEKNHATMLEALALLPSDYALVLAGTGETLGSCRRLAERLGVAERVLFAGIRCDIPAVYAAADVAVLSSLYEGLSLAAVEAMASGRPLVASDVDGLRSTVSPGAVLFPSGDSEALADSIRRLCTDPALWQSTAKACMKKAAMFDISSTAEGYDKVYADCK